MWAYRMLALLLLWAAAAFGQVSSVPVRFPTTYIGPAPGGVGGLVAHAPTHAAGGSDELPAGAIAFDPASVWHTSNRVQTALVSQSDRLFSPDNLTGIWARESGPASLQYTVAGVPVGITQASASLVTHEVTPGVGRRTVWGVSAGAAGDLLPIANSFFVRDLSDPSGTTFWEYVHYGSGSGSLRGVHRVRFIDGTVAGGNQDIVALRPRYGTGDNVGDVVFSGDVGIGSTGISLAPSATLDVGNGDAGGGNGEVRFRRYNTARDDTATDTPAGWYYPTSAGNMKYAPMGKWQLVSGDGLVDEACYDFDTSTAGTQDARVCYNALTGLFTVEGSGLPGKVRLGPLGVPEVVVLAAASSAINPSNRNNAVEVTGDVGGNTVTTIDGTGYAHGDPLELTYTGGSGSVTLVDNASPGSNQMALAGNLVFTADTIIRLRRTGNYWREISRSVN